MNFQLSIADKIKISIRIWKQTNFIDKHSTIIYQLNLSTLISQHTLLTYNVIVKLNIDQTYNT